MFSISFLFQKLQQTEDVDEIGFNESGKKFFPGESFEVACNCTNRQPAQTASQIDDCQGNSSRSRLT